MNIKHLSFRLLASSDFQGVPHASVIVRHNWANGHPLVRASTAPCPTVQRTGRGVSFSLLPPQPTRKELRYTWRAIWQTIFSRARGQIFLSQCHFRVLSFTTKYTMGAATKSDKSMVQVTVRVVAIVRSSDVRTWDRRAAFQRLGDGGSARRKAYPRTSATSATSPTTMLAYGTRE
jgi:hypothetical protein